MQFNAQLTSSMKSQPVSVTCMVRFMNRNQLQVRKFPVPLWLAENGHNYVIVCSNFFLFFKAGGIQWHLLIIIMNVYFLDYLVCIQHIIELSRPTKFGCKSFSAILLSIFQLLNIVVVSNNSIPESFIFNEPAAWDNFFSKSGNYSYKISISESYNFSEPFSVVKSLKTLN